MNKSTKRRILTAAALMIVFAALFSITVFAAETEGEAPPPALFGTFWSLLPPIIAIGRA